MRIPNIRAFLKRRRTARFSTPSYAQEGEDLVLGRIFGEQQSGFYVDVGAHHPHRFSNTWLFYQRGWRGINIDATPGSMAAFSKSRPRDVNIECGVAEHAGECRFFLFNEPALNTFDERVAKGQENHRYHITSSVVVPQQPLSVLLDRHLPAGATIDFLSVDAEGRDLDVLRSNDWARFRPRIVIAECALASIAMVSENQISSHLASLGYVLFAKTFKSCFYAEPAWIAARQAPAGGAHG